MARKKPKWWEPRTRFSVEAFAHRLWEVLDTPVSLKLSCLAKAEQWVDVAGASIDPMSYRHQADFYVDHLATSAIRKWENMPTGIDKEQVAFEKFIEAEEICALTNERLCPSGEYKSASRLPAHVNAVMFTATRKIASILPNVVPDVEDLMLRFGPGAATGVRGDTSAYNKLHSVPECTDAMLPILGSLIFTLPTWFPDGFHDVDLVEGSELFFVPKNALTYRSCCFEPLLNGMMQRAYGKVIRQGLRRYGVNLNDQSVNQRLARSAATHGLATVDFSMASDTIASALVWDLLPFEWAEALDNVRSPSFKYGDAERTFEKFSSMGNAYTFELESLIFYALAVSCCEALGIRYNTGANLHVYGDDVIIPREAFDLYQEVCSHAGFSINPEKSYAKGPFYESCGTDYFLGHDVRPFFLKKGLTSLQGMYYAANQTLAAASKLEDLNRDPRSTSHDTRIQGLRDLHAWVVGCIPASHRLLVPLGWGDCGLVADCSIALPRTRLDKERKLNQWGVVRQFCRLAAVPVPTEILDGEAPSAYPTYLLDDAEASNDLPYPWEDEPDTTTDKGREYQPRGNTVFRKVWSPIPDEWPICPLWGDKAIRLVNVRS